MFNRRFVCVGVAAVAAATLVAGCGSSGGSSGGSKPAASVAATAATGTPIVIGNIGSYSGAQASSEAGAQTVIKAWSQWVNAHGGVSGHPIKLIVKDTGANSASGLTAAKDLVENQHVVAIVGDEDNNDQSWASYVQSKNVPVIGGLTLNIPFLVNPDFFSSGTNTVALLYGNFSAARKFGPTSAVFYCAESPQCAAGVPLYTALAKAAGLTLPVVAKVSGTAPDYTALCQQLKDKKVDSYWVASGSAVVLKVVGSCAAQGVTAKSVADDGSFTPSWLKEPAFDGLRGVELTAPWFDSSVPGTKEYQDVIAAYAADLGNQNNPNAFYAFASGKLFEKAVAGIPAGTAVTAQSLKDSLWTFKGETLGGIVPPLTFAKTGNTPVNCYFSVGIDNSKFVTPNGLKTTCAPDALVAAVAKQLGGWRRVGSG